MIRNLCLIVLVLGILQISHGGMQGSPESKKRFRRPLQLPKPNPLGILRRGNRIFVPAEIVARETRSASVFMSRLRVTPHKDLRGRMVGFRLKRLDRGSFGDSLGFVQGDVIQEINRKSLKSMSAIFKVFTRLKKSKKEKIEVVFLRKNKKIRWEVIKVNPKSPARTKEKQK